MTFKSGIASDVDLLQYWFPDILVPALGFGQMARNAYSVRETGPKSCQSTIQGTGIRLLIDDREFLAQPG